MVEPIKLEEADRQQEAIKKVMAEQKIPFEEAVDVYIKSKSKMANR